MHHYSDLIRIFNQCFEQTHRTKLMKGEDEPLYLPADEKRPHHAVFFAHGFFSSALHECAHWLIAGKARRLLPDYGYWYAPDGRSAEEQKCFERVEVKPQALEWILSAACGYRFHISLDNLTGEPTDRDSFSEAVYLQVFNYCREGLSKRAEYFRAALCDFYGTPPVLSIKDFIKPETWVR